jgi:hypothetical protein
MALGLSERGKVIVVGKITESAGRGTEVAFKRMDQQTWTEYKLVPE